MFSLSAVSEDGPDPHPVVRLVIATGCAYEVAALVTRRVPTLSSVCRAHRWFEGLLLAWLVVHFHYVRKQAEQLPD